MSKNTNPLDELEKLFALKKSGALTDAEFDAEKARILDAGRPASPSTIGTTDNLEATDHSAIQARRFMASKLAKAAFGLVALLAICLVVWQAARNDWFSEVRTNDSKTSSDDVIPNADQVTEPLDQDGARPEEAASVGAVFSWTLKSDNGSLMALYGGKQTSASFTLDCLTSEKMIEFAEFDVQKPPSMIGRILVGASRPYQFSGFYDDDEYAYFGFKVPADNEIWAELAKGGSDLTVSVDGAKPYNLPRSPVLSQFVSNCLAKM